MNKPATWIDHLQNGQALREAFGDSIAELPGLELQQLVFDPAGDLALTLGVDSLPDVVPVRWKDKGFDRLQFRMRFATGALAIRRNDVLGTPKVHIELGDNRLHMTSEDGSFELTASFLDARLDFHPYRAKDYEFPPTWYTQF